jgi:F0F1-type ATP synthase epsilon subunit
MSLKITVYTPSRVVCNTVTDEVSVPIDVGHFTIKNSFQKHSASISIGLLRIKDGASWSLFSVAAGMVEVENNQVTIFVADAEEIKFVDVPALNAELKQKLAEKFDNVYEKLENLERIRVIRAFLQASKFL